MTKKIKLTDQSWRIANCHYCGERVLGRAWLRVPPEQRICAVCIIERDRETARVESYEDKR